MVRLQLTQLGQRTVRFRELKPGGEDLQIMEKNKNSSRNILNGQSEKRQTINNSNRLKAGSKGVESKQTRGTDNLLNKKSVGKYRGKQ